MLGFGVVAPVLPGLIVELTRVDISTAAEYAGWLGAGYAAMQFVFAPVIGNLSDRFGRRPVLLLSVLLLGLDYLVQATAPHFWWLVIGRLVAGITGASFSAAYAYIADVTPPERRAAAFGTLGLAFGVGFVVGPAVGGLLGGIDGRLPFYAAAALSLTNFAFGFLFLKESLPRENRRPFDWRRANAMASLRVLRGQSPRVLWFVAALGVWQLAHVVYPAVWPYFTIAAYGFTAREVGLSLAVVGFSSALVQSVGLRFALPRLGERRAVILGVTSLGVAAVLYAVAQTTWQIYAAIAVGSLQGFVQAPVAALNSRAVDARSQGELQGAVQSVGSLAAIIGPPFYTQILAAFSGPAAIMQLPAMPLLVAAGVALVTLALFLKGAGLMPRADQDSSSTSQ